MISKKIFISYFELLKPRITLLVLITTTLGYYLGGQGFLSWDQYMFLMIGTASICGGSAALNHYLEREYDIKMNRTHNRPIPSGIISPSNALNFGIILTLSGLFILYIEINILTSFLSLLTSFLYIMVYTPMKRVSWLNTTVGAIPGAIPPLGGWAAATGGLSFDAGMLFLILFIWQHPHFYAIAWMYKEDYARGGFKMLPVVEPDGERMFKHIIYYSIALIPMALMPTITGLSGYYYFTGMLISGFVLLNIAQNFARSHTVKDARRLLMATVYYLPILLTLIILDAQF